MQAAIINWMGGYYNSLGFGSAFTADSGLELNGKVTDPLFVDYTNDDFHILQSSPCIDAGTDVGLTTDYDNTILPMGMQPDIGIFEFIQEIAPPTNLRMNYRADK